MVVVIGEEIVVIRKERSMVLGGDGGEILGGVGF